VIHVLYSDRSLIWLAIRIVSAEMLNCKLLSAQAAGIKYIFVLYMMRWKSPMASHSRTLAKHCMCSGDKPNFCCMHKYKRMIKSKLTASNTIFNSVNIP
jgi:hypothetical protein